MSEIASTSATAQPAEQSANRPNEVQIDSKADTAPNGDNDSEEGTNGIEVKADITMKGEDASMNATEEDNAPPQNQEAEDVDKSVTNSENADMDEGDNTAADADAGSNVGVADTKKSRRKSAVPEHRAKKLNRKASNLKQLHLDAKPGDYYMVKLKGYPTWPAVICDEAMLPQALLASRPQTAARGDGSYREEYADGGKRVKERTYPVMFMATNEFAWTPNTDLRDFDVEASSNFPPNRTKNLNLAHQLASEQHPLSHWKDVLAEFQESVHKAAEEEMARKLAKEEKEKKKAAKKSTKSVEEGDDEDDTAMDLGPDSAAEPKKKKPAKKRELAEGDNKDTPATKKFKLTFSKSANGTPASSAKPKSEKKESVAKPKKAAKQKEVAVEASKPVEPELSPEEQRAKKEREILFLRHKLQKGLLNRDAPPEESQMATMAEYINKLEGYPDLEVSIIKTTKINKVLKAILKLDAIPKEAEFNFKSRSIQLLAKWNHILDNAPKDTTASAPTNGLANGDIKVEPSEKQSSDVKEEESNGTNDVKELEPESSKADDQDVEMKDEAATEIDTVMEDAAKSEVPASEPAPQETEDTALPDAPVEAATS